nr:hypothetical protein [Porphyromonas gingivalis]
MRIATFSRAKKRRLAGPKNAARKSFPFGARKEKFTRHNEKNLASLFPKTRTVTCTEKS